MNIEHKHNVLQPNFDWDNIENALKSWYKFSIYQENERYIINAKYKDKTRGFLSKKSVEDIRQTISQTKETTTNFNYNKENIKNNLMNLLNAWYTINIFYNSDNLFQTQVIQNWNIIKSWSYTYLTTSLAIIIWMSSQNIEKVIS
jgi:hypothetical protein